MNIIKTVKKENFPEIDYVLAPDGTLLALVKEDNGETCVVAAEDFDTLFLAGPRKAASTILMASTDVDAWLGKNFPKDENEPHFVIIPEEQPWQLPSGAFRACGGPS